MQQVKKLQSLKLVICSEITALIKYEEQEFEFNLEIYDARGSKLISENGLIILPGQVAKLDLTGLTPALYLLKVIPSVQGNQKIFKITKQ